MNSLDKIDPQKSKFTFSGLTNTLPLGYPPFSDKINPFIPNAKEEYIQGSYIFAISYQQKDSINLLTKSDILQLNA